MTQFTANEVRDWERAYKGTGAAKVFGAFADLLEAQERAVPVMVVNHVSSAEHDLPIGLKLYAHPATSDAERLAEALLRNWFNLLCHAGIDAREEKANSTLRRIMDIAKQVSSEIAKYENITQAQPPAASVPAEYREIARLIGSIFCAGGFKAETRNEMELEKLLKKTGNWFEPGDQVPESFLVARENPNG